MAERYAVNPTGQSSGPSLFSNPSLAKRILKSRIVDQSREESPIVIKTITVGMIGNRGWETTVEYSNASTREIIEIEFEFFLLDKGDHEVGGGFAKYIESLHPAVVRMRTWTWSSGGYQYVAQVVVRIKFARFGDGSKWNAPVRMALTADVHGTSQTAQMPGRRRKERFRVSRRRRVKGC